MASAYIFASFAKIGMIIHNDTRYETWVPYTNVRVKKAVNTIPILTISKTKKLGKNICLKNHGHCFSDQKDILLIDLMEHRMTLI